MILRYNVPFSEIIHNKKMMSLTIQNKNPKISEIGDPFRAPPSGQRLYYTLDSGALKSMLLRALIER